MNGASEGAGANPERGEHELELGGATYLLRPSHAALRAIEKKTGRSTLELVRLGDAAALGLDQIGIIAAELVRAGANGDLSRQVHPERMSELIFEDGLARGMGRLTLCLLDAASGGRTASGEAKAATATSPTTSGDAGAA